MTHLFLLRLHILPVILLCRNLQRYSLIDLQSEFAKSIDFIRIIVSNLNDFTPRSDSICAPTQYSLRSGANPNFTLALHSYRIPAPEAHMLVSY